MPVDLNKIRGCGIVPVALVGGKEVKFLLGREQEFKGWSGSGKYADFGGKREEGENVLACAAREGYEESMGVLGSEKELREKVLPSSKDYIDAFAVENVNEHFVIVVRSFYNKYLPKLFRDVFEYFIRCGKKRDEGKYEIAGCPEGFLEKDEIRWFGYDELRQLVMSGEGRGESGGSLLRPYFARCMEVMFDKYPTEKDLVECMRGRR